MAAIASVIWLCAGVNNGHTEYVHAEIFIEPIIAILIIIIRVVQFGL